MKQEVHRYAAHEVHIGQRVLHQAYVEIRGGAVVGYGDFQEEPAFTEWLGGTSEVKENEDGSFFGCRD